MQLGWSLQKERANRIKHGFDFSLAERIIADPLVLLVYDRFEGGEHRHHAIGVVRREYLVVVHTYPDPDDEDFIRVIGLRPATHRERKRYEEGDE